MDEDKAQQVVDEQVSGIVELKNKIDNTETALMENPQFREFLELQKSFNEKSSEVWTKVEQLMIDNGVKSVKGSWGSITLAERTSYKAVDLDKVPRKFIKRTLDTTKVGQSHKLENELPRGVEANHTQYLMKRIK